MSAYGLPIVESDTVSDWKAPVNLDEVVEALAADIECPVVLYGATLRLLAFSSHESDVDQARRSVILSRRASARATEMIGASGASRSREPVRIPVHQPTGTPGRVAYAVRWRDQVVGYLIYVDEHPDEPLPRYHAEALHAAGEQLSQLLHDREQVRRQEEEQVLGLLRRRTSGNADDRAKAADEAVRSGGSGLPARMSPWLSPPAPPSATARCRPASWHYSKRPSPRCCGWHRRERPGRCSATTRW